jgi:hypothetical protein
MVRGQAKRHDLRQFHPGVEPGPVGAEEQFARPGPAQRLGQQVEPAHA